MKHVASWTAHNPTRRKLNLLLKQIVLDKNDLLYEKYNFIPCCKSVQVGPFFWMEITFGQFSAFAFS